MATYSILLSKRVGVQSSLEAVAKHAAKLGLQPLMWTWGEAEERGSDHVISLTIQGEAPSLDGWSFLAALEHTASGVIVRVVPGETIPVSYQTANANCDHCMIARKRIRTYVLRHDDSRIVQVGSSCLRDFFGGQNISGVLAKAEIATEIANCVSDECGFSSPSGEVYLPRYLRVVVQCIRAYGWLSRSKAEESGKKSTADIAMDCLFDAKDAGKLNAACPALDSDREEAIAAIEWAKGIFADGNDYLHNIQVIARNNYTSFRDAGYAASIIIAHRREIERERAKAEAQAVSCHIGTIGAKVAFGCAAKKHEQLSADPLTLIAVITWESQYGTSTLLKFRTSSGATVVWKTSDCGITRIDVGKRYVVRGTIKSHNEYNDVKETVLTRCKIEEVSN